MYNWVFFDADNTLFDFDASSILAFEALVDQLNIPQSPDLYKTYKKHNTHVWNLFENRQIDTQNLRSRRFELFFNEIGFDFDGLKANNLYLDLLVDNVRLLDGALELLEKLKGLSIKMLIITNGLKEVQKPRLNKVGLTHFFEDIIVSDEIGVAKPDGAFFDFADKAANHASKSEVLVVGDSINSDIQGGNLYGYDTCWYNPKRHKNNSGILPKYVIGDLSAIPTLVQD